MFANVRVYDQGRLEERLAEQRPYREARNVKVDLGDREEERRLLTELIQYVPDLRGL